MKRAILLFAALLLIAGSSVSAQPKLHIVDSRYLHCNDTVAVWSPAAAAAQKSIPTVFLLHGWSGCWSNWGNKMDLQALSDETGWRIICPDGFYAGWYIDNADPEKMQWRTFFWEELWPLLSEEYGLDPDRTFITGLSMGGHGAMNVFLDRPECFAGGGSMSGVLDLRYASGATGPIPEMLGKKNISECSGQSAVWRLDDVLNRVGPAVMRNKVIVVTCGTEDSLYPSSVAFSTRCRELGLPVVAMYSKGVHSWQYWTYIVRYHIGWFAEQMEKLSAQKN